MSSQPYSRRDKYIAQNLRHLRNLRGLTQAQIAQIVGVSRPAYGSYEEGRALPSAETVLRISDYYDVSITDLMYANLRQITETTPA